MDMGLLPEVRRTGPVMYDMASPEALVLTAGDGFYRQNLYGANELQELCAATATAAAPHSSITYDSSAAAAPPSLAVSANDGETASSDAVSIREKIAAHPSYHRLLLAYVNCRKVGAPPDVALRLDQLRQDYEAALQPTANAADSDPELDQFMDAYCQVLHHYHEELSRPFNEAMAFLARVKTQIKSITKDDEEAGEVVEGGEEDGHQQLLGMEDIYYGEEGGDEDDVQEEEEGGSCGEVDYDDMQHGYMNGMLAESMHAEADTKHIRDELRLRYRGYIGTLKKEFMKKKKKGKLPKDARQCLLEWWNKHYKWPYPSETEKATLAESTGLDQKQINNWFINQRKRHWKPLDDPRYVMPTNGQDRPMQDPNALY